MGPAGDLSVRFRGYSINGTLCSEELSGATKATLTSPGDRISLPQNQLRFLRSFVDLCGFEAAWMQCELLERQAGTTGKPEPTLVYGRPSFLFRRKNKEELRENHLSFGQKRLLSFLYYTTLAGPIVADELVDGLHFDWIEACVEEVRGRQKFFASQNPLLVDHMPGFKTRERVKSRFLRCMVEGDEMVWTSLSDAEADDFFVAYRTGISGVSEVLRQKGLW